MREASLLVWLCAGLCGCGAREEHGSHENLAERSWTVLNGNDDRRDLYEIGSERVRESVSGSVAALMWSHRIQFGDSDSVILRAPSLASRLGVCDDEPFAEQPAAAHCSAVLIDSDLVLTAGHCLGADLVQAEDRCRRLWIVFDYSATGEDHLALRTGASVYSCRSVVQHAKVDSTDHSLDLAILQLDRTTDESRVVVSVATPSPVPGEQVIAATHGAGLPLKVDQGASIIDVPEPGNVVVANTDSFGGGSGGALYNQALELMAYQVRGEPDWEVVDDCRRSVRSGQSKEEHQLAVTALQSLCTEGWPSQRLCGTRPECGDGHCTGLESFADCPLDCLEQVCGDGTCERTERAECEIDCQPFRDVPASWELDPLEYVPKVSGRRAEVAGCAVGFAGRGTPQAWICLALWFAWRHGRRALRRGTLRAHS